MRGQSLKKTPVDDVDVNVGACFWSWWHRRPPNNSRQFDAVRETKNRCRRRCRRKTESVRKPKSAVIELRSNVDEKIKIKMREKLLRLFLVCLCSATILTSVSGSVSDRKVRRHFYLMPYPIFEDGLKGDQLVFIGRDRLHPPENVGHSRSKRQGNKKVSRGTA